MRPGESVVADVLHQKGVWPGYSVGICDPNGVVRIITRLSVSGDVWPQGRIKRLDPVISPISHCQLSDLLM